VPLSWFHSTTYAFFPDETHRAIRRTFVSPFEDSTRRQFCGYCGTQISQWQETDQGEQDFINLTLGSLVDEDLERLRELGMLEVEGERKEEEEEEEEVTGQESDVQKYRPIQGVAHRGAPWFEEMAEKTPLGKVKRQKGGHTTTSGDSTVEVEWEVFEWNGDEGESTTGTPKRKIGEVDEAHTELRS
jgi:hypothetical protein